MASLKCFVLFSLIALAALSGAFPLSQQDHLRRASSRLARAKAVLTARRNNEGLDECFGQGAICQLAITLYDRCDTSGYSTEKYQKKVECQCKSGVVSIEVA